MDDVAKRVYGRAYVDNIEESIAYHLKYESYRDNTPVTDALEDAILSKHPKHRYVVGGLLAKASWRNFIPYNFLPTWLSDINMFKQQASLGVPVYLQGKDKNS